jgi:hypothetical protein
MTDMDRVLQVERRDERREVVGITLHVVAVPGLAGAAVAAAVMGDAAVALSGQEDHLVFEGVRAERPAVAEHHRLSTAPILIIDWRAVCRRDRAHRVASLCMGRRRRRGHSRGVRTASMSASGERIRAILVSGLGLMTCLHNLLHSSHFTGFEPDLDTVWVVGRFCEDVFHDAASQPPATLMLLLRDVHPQTWRDVFAALTVHALASFT